MVNPLLAIFIPNIFLAKFLHTHEHEIERKCRGKCVEMGIKAG